jgi:hypothetical protein
MSARTAASGFDFRIVRLGSAERTVDLHRPPWPRDRLAVNRWLRPITWWTMLSLCGGFWFGIFRMLGIA